ncbi:hypothetical protein RJ639_016449, partial [Escallonia herrerae]
MVSLVAGSTATMLESWERKVGNEEGCVKIGVGRDLRSLLANITARACFGNNHLQAKKAFLKLDDLQKILSNGNIGVPSLRYMSTKPNSKAWQLEKEINSMIICMSLQEAAKRYEENGDLPSNIGYDKFMVDNCKNIYFTCYDTTTTLVLWCLVLLATHIDWQARICTKVHDICGDNLQDVDMLRSMKTATIPRPPQYYGYDTTATSVLWCLVLFAAHLDWQARIRTKMHDICGDNLPDVDILRTAFELYKIRASLLTMVIQETLCLYPSVPNMVRETMQDVSLNSIHIPKGVNLYITRPTLHQDPNLWGIDTLQELAYLHRSTCHLELGHVSGAGQHFSMAELKVILSQILSRFSFTLSHRHSPALRLVIEPEHGVYPHIRK